MIKEIRIQNYKSIVDLTLELGKTNVFIGENGCGKTNILEAFAMLSGAANGRLSLQDLSNIGVRVAKPSLTKSSFASNGHQGNSIRFEVNFKNKHYAASGKYDIENEGKGTLHDKWIEIYRNKIFSIPENYKEQKTVLEKGEAEEKSKQRSIYLFLAEILRDYLVFDLNTPALRGQNPQSFMTPMGIHGEGLDIALESLDENEIDRLLKFKYLISWLDEIKLDDKNELQLNNLRLKGNSQLYFSDKFMKKNALFNSENANEGVLHILFYLTLFIHQDTPNIFAIDNIETALNPLMCRELMKIITQLNKEKQVLITTHNPAILDGLDLTNDDIRLFEVRRNKKGYTEANRIQFKKGMEKKFKLSEMWMKGMLGAIPTNF